MITDFLSRFYASDKKLFTLLVLYCAGVFYFALKQREEFPFLLYGMYSLKENPQKNYFSFEILVNGKKLDWKDIPDASRELILSPLSHTVSDIEISNENKKEVARFGAWLKEYFPNNPTIQINRLQCIYKAGGKPSILHQEIVYDSQ